MSTANGLVSDVAVKVLRADVDPGGQAIQRLRDEAALLATLNHPAILKVVDLVVIESRIALVTEFVDGADLSVCMEPPDPLPLSALLEVIGSVAGALDAALTWPSPATGRPLQLVHRDIKPGNIRISRHGAVKLLDFGIARSDEMSREARTQTDMLVGSPAYMAPERFLTGENRSESDLFSLGCCLFEGIVGQRLFAELSVPRMSALALDDDRYRSFVATRMARLPTTLPPEVVALLTRTLDFDPGARGLPHELAVACDELRERVPGPSLSRWARGRSWPAVVASGGPLSGRTIAESGVSATADRTQMMLALDRTDEVPTSTLARAPSPLPEPPAASPRRGLAWLAALSASGLLIGAVVSVGAILLVAVAAWWGSRVGGDPSAAVAVATSPEVVVAPASEVPAVAAPVIPAAPAAAPDPVVTRGAPRSTPAVVAPAAVAPTAPTEAAPREPDLVRVALTGADSGWRAWAISGDRRLALPASLPPGKYLFEAQHDGEPTATLGDAEVRAGAAPSVRCARWGCALTTP
jgi:hypothetical protein